jgi:cytochrome c-type biogenesis protein CcmE
MSSLLDDVNELLRQNQGDLGTLQNIKKTLEANKILYMADRQYVTRLTKKLMKDNTPKVHSTKHAGNSESIRELEQKIRADRTED